jgi:hypothetical protein
VRVSTEGFVVSSYVPDYAVGLNGARGGRIVPGDRIVFRTEPQGICASKTFTVTDDPGMTVSPPWGPVGTEVVLKGHDCGSIPDERRTLLSGEVFHVGDPVPSAVTVRRVPVEEFVAHFEIPKRAHELNGAGGGKILVGDRILFTTAPGGICEQFFVVT